MAWIESNIDIADHPKTLKLASILKTDIQKTVGAIHLLWHFTMKFAWRDGNLEKFGEDAIASGSKWTGKPSDFVAALQQSGFLDGMVVHDWLDCAGRLVTDRIYNELRRKTAHYGVKRRKTSVSVQLPTNPTNQHNLPTIPPSALFDLWNKKAHEVLPRAQTLSKGRAIKCKTRLGENPDLSWWDSVINRMNDSLFLLGKGDRGWTASFDWLIDNQENAIKILEGKYDNSRFKNLQAASENPEYERALKNTIARNNNV